MRVVVFLSIISLCLSFSLRLFSQTTNSSINDPIYEKIQEKDSVSGMKSTAITYRRPAIATLYSLAYPGAGQFYNGQKNKAVGFIVWKLISDFWMVIAFERTMDQFMSRPPDAYPIMFLVSLTSAATSWVVSMIDANLSARKINKYNGFTLVQFGNEAKLSLNPDLRLIPIQNTPIKHSLTPTIGFNLRLSF
jgi:hypothetical protein